jgi:ATPase subunit of ABC transporter with duplicated ATPase domains
MLQVQHLRKSYGITTVLSDVSFLVNDGEHVGLISPNGTGKSTLLRCMVGQEQPDAGTLSFAPPQLSIGYLPQSFGELADQRVGEAVASAQADVLAAEAALQHTADQLATAADIDSAMLAYDAALARFEALGGYEREHRAAAVLAGLGLGAIDATMPVRALSGGQKTRLGLALLLLGSPDLLLLDEPTNHLDVEALAWLERFVQSYPGAVLIVSHDREFLNQTATRILYLDPTAHTIKSYSGTYNDFADARAQEREQQLATWQDQQEYVQGVQSDIRRLKGQAMSIQQGPKRHRDYYGAISAKVARLSKTRERKLDRYLSSDERVEKPRSRWGLKLDFGPPPPGGRAVLRLDDVAFSYEVSSEDEGRRTKDEGPAARLLEDVTFEVAYGERLALVGPNGAGKTTLLRLIAGQLQPLSGTIRLGANVRLGVLSQEQETLDMRATVLQSVLGARAMSETDARNFLHFFLFGGDGVFREVGACSLGERSRLQLALLVLQGCNLLLLDEPLNHLDIDGREHFEEALDAFEGTVIAVAHDRAFLRSFAERVVEVRDGRVRVVVGGYDDYVRTAAR